MFKSELLFRRGGLALRYSLFLLAAFLFIFSIAFIYTLTYTRNILENDARKRASDVTDLTISKITGVLRPIEQVPNTLALVLGSDHPDYRNILEIARSFVAEDSLTFGSALAFEPFMHDPGHDRYCAYFFESHDRIIRKDLSGPEYDYLNRDWYRIPKMLGKPVWSEPYYDKGGGDTLMCTYSVPFYREVRGNRIFAGVVTMDISLKTFHHIVNSVTVYRDGFNFLVSHKGKFITYPVASLVNQDIQDLVPGKGDPATVRTLRKMLNGERLFTEISSLGPEKIPSRIYFAPIPNTGWVFALTFPTRELYAGLNSFFRILAIIFSLSLLLMILLSVLITRNFTQPIHRLLEATHRIGKGDFAADLPVTRSRDEIAQLSNSFSVMKEDLVRYIRNLKETTVQKERIESELKIARDIQMGMVPGIFPAFPGRNEFDIHGFIQPAREVGGDLYDFFLIDEDHLCFAIGDVSGKGTPAALFMAMTLTLLRAEMQIAGLNAGKVLELTNQYLCRHNNLDLFVTLFLGILDIPTGVVEFVNAGHNPPFLLRNEGTVAEVETRHCLPLGVEINSCMERQYFRMETGDLLFLYTDGISESFNRENRQYSIPRIGGMLQGQKNRTPRELIRRIVEDVRNFSQGTEQSDDISLLAIRYAGDRNKRPVDKLYEFTVASSGNGLPGLVAGISGACTEQNIPEETVFKVRLAAEEILTNTIRYGLEGHHDQSILVKLRFSPGSILLEIRDQGREFDPSGAPDPDITSGLDERKVGGMGIRLVKKLADRMDYRREGNENINEITIRY